MVVAVGISFITMQCFTSSCSIIIVLFFWFSIHTFSSGALSLQVPISDNYFTALNSAVFSDGSFVYIPKGVKSPMELSTYFRINASETGQVRACVYICMS